MNILPGRLPSRLWFYNEAETELVQVQPDRFIFNWKRGLVAAAYPHYEKIRPSFEAQSAHFREFVTSNGLGEIEIKQCEITYINHIESESDGRDLESLIPSSRFGLGTSKAHYSIT